MMLRTKIKKLLKKIIGQEARLEHPANLAFGDYSTNAAMVAKLNPQELAEKLSANPLFEKVEAVNGFVNFFLSGKCLRQELADVLKRGDKFGDINLGKNKKVQVEFISANPTGPLTVGNGRGGFMGDCLANVLRAAGFAVQREYYINDRGTQIESLKKGLYKGEERTWNKIQKENQKFIAKKLRIKFDVWFSEKSLYKTKQVESVLSLLERKCLTYRQENALWLKTMEFGDDKDRVLVRKDGEPTYFLSDIAYFKNKMARGFTQVINLWGADHHGYVPRYHAMIKALGYSAEKWQPIIFQLVQLLKNGKEVKMSKRKGVFISLEWLIGEVGLDAARFFFLTRSADNHLNFDLGLAKEQSDNNPVYYIQYAHARICSILRKFKAENSKFRHIDTSTSRNFKLLKHPSELRLIKQLIKLPEIIEDTTRDYQVQRVPQYALDLAAAFHQFYRDCKVLEADKKTSEAPHHTAQGQARLALVLAAQIVLKKTLGLMGISSPAKM